jgi:phage FluMu protein Com
MNIVKCSKCGACLASSEDESVQINTLHVEGLARVRMVDLGIETTVRCRHCKRVTITVLLRRKVSCTCPG